MQLRTYTIYWRTFIVSEAFLTAVKLYLDEKATSVALFPRPSTLNSITASKITKPESVIGLRTASSEPNDLDINRSQRSTVKVGAIGQHNPVRMSILHTEEPHAQTQNTIPNTSNTQNLGATKYI